MFHRLRSSLLAGVLLFTPAVSRAITIYDNLSEPLGGSDTVNVTQWNANKFVTDSSTYLLSLVTLRLSATNTTSPIDVLLYSDSSNSPGTQLASIGSTSAVGGSASDFGFATATSLAANTAYWIVMRSSGSGTYLSYFPNTLTGTGSAFSSVYARSNTGGASWVLGVSSFPPYYMQLNAADVPEPGSMLLGAIGLALLGLRARRS